MAVRCRRLVWSLHCHYIEWKTWCTQPFPRCESYFQWEASSRPVSWWNKRACLCVVGVGVGVGESSIVLSLEDFLFGLLDVEWTWIVTNLEYLALALADRMAWYVFPQFVQRAVCHAVECICSTLTTNGFSISRSHLARKQVVRFIKNETK